MVRFTQMLNSHARALGRLGGLAGGRAGGAARAKALTPERRKEIARNAALARWDGRVPEIVRDRFWTWADNLDETINTNVDTATVMYQVCAFGSREQKRWLARRYGVDAVKLWISNTPRNGLTFDQMVEWIPRSKARAIVEMRSAAESLWDNR